MKSSSAVTDIKKKNLASISPKVLCVMRFRVHSHPYAAVAIKGLLRWVLYPDVESGLSPSFYRRININITPGFPTLHPLSWSKNVDE